MRTPSQTIPAMILAAGRGERMRPLTDAMGGAFEAWLYVEPHRPLWEPSGALNWARSLPKRKAR